VLPDMSERVIQGGMGDTAASLAGGACEGALSANAGVGSPNDGEIGASDATGESVCVCAPSLADSFVVVRAGTASLSSGAEANLSVFKGVATGAGGRARGELRGGRPGLRADGVWEVPGAIDWPRMNWRRRIRSAAGPWKVSTRRLGAHCIDKRPDRNMPFTI